MNASGTISMSMTKLDRLKVVQAVCERRLKLGQAAGRLALNGCGYAPSFVADFNRRFGKPPKSDHDTYRPLRVDEDLKQILAYRVPRKVSNALIVQYDRVMYLLQDTATNRRLMHAYIEEDEYWTGRSKFTGRPAFCPAAHMTGSRGSTKARGGEQAVVRSIGSRASGAGAA